MTRIPVVFARSVISSSVIPSLKYSCAGSAERLRSGSTASDVGVSPNREAGSRPRYFQATLIAARIRSEIKAITEMLTRFSFGRKRGGGDGNDWSSVGSLDFSAV